MLSCCLNAARSWGFPSRPLRCAYVKYPNLLDLWSRYANAEVGASNSQVNSGTVLFVLSAKPTLRERASRFIRRCLKQRRDPRPGNPALEARACCNTVLLSVHRQISAFRRHIVDSTDSPWNYDSVVNQPGQVSSLSSASTLYT